MRSRGFTLIELVIVIVILGIIAVTAAPKFINLSSNAQIASIKGVSAGLHHIVEMTKIQAHLQRKSDQFNYLIGCRRCHRSGLIMTQ